MSNTKMPAKLTPVHCIVFPLLTIAVLDGFTEEEREDMVNTVLTLGGDDGMFSLTTDMAVQNFGETMEWFKSMEYKDALATSMQCCNTIHKMVTNDDTRGAIISFMLDTVKADGKVSENEKTLVASFATVILNGIKS
jgi:hypothetical protein